MSKIFDINAKKQNEINAKKYQIDEISNEILDMENKLKELYKKRSSLENQIFSPEEIANINILRRAKKLDW